MNSKCNVCFLFKSENEFYKSDKTCKECRKAKNRDNRRGKSEYYKEYDKFRYKNDPKVKERHKRYAKSEAGKAAHLKNAKQDIFKNPEKRAARVAVGNAVRDGKLLKPKHCSSCLMIKPLQGHHEDYLKPLDVIWLCAKCHKDLHKRNENDRYN